MAWHGMACKTVKIFDNGLSLSMATKNGFKRLTHPQSPI